MKWFQDDTEQKSLFVVSILLVTRTWPLHHIYEHCWHSKFQRRYANLLCSNITQQTNKQHNFIYCQWQKQTFLFHCIGANRQHTSCQKRTELNKLRFIKFRIKPFSLARFRTIMKHKMDNNLPACYFFTNMNSVLIFQIISLTRKLNRVEYK